MVLLVSERFPLKDPPESNLRAHYREVFVTVVSPLGSKVWEHRKRNILQTSCWVAAPFQPLTQPIRARVCVFVCVHVCLFASVWVRLVEHLSRGDPAHSWAPPALTVPHNFLLWLELRSLGRGAAATSLEFMPLKTRSWLHTLIKKEKKKKDVKAVRLGTKKKGATLWGNFAWDRNEKLQRTLSLWAI